MRSIVIHGHFYQPPRDNPWLERVDQQPGAAPFHDWNHRIERECYRTVVAARIPGPTGRIARIVNALAEISFNVGPTLLDWMEREAPSTYAAILHADWLSTQRLGGHGNALAMPCHHPILPLSTPRDRVTEVRWGIADFRRRFGRDPEGMWLPETAVDLDTLDVLAQEGIRFTVLAPHQVATPLPRGLPGLVDTGHGRSIAVFTYDGTLSHGVAFGSLIRDGVTWAHLMAASAETGGDPELVAVATDGETYGHHHRYGDLALARVLAELASRPGVRVENFASFLARHPVEHEVAIVEPTSWSCSHGVERWRADCGCRMSADGTSQAWRAPLRAAVTWLAERCHEHFTAAGAAYFADPWAARDAYGAVAGAEPAEAQALVRDVMLPPADPERVACAAELLELERNALRLFTSCAWFFDDVGGVEPVQVLRYAARALELLGDPDVEREWLARLARAHSNDPTRGTARDIFLREARSLLPAAARAAAGWALLGAVGATRGRSPVGVWEIDDEGEGILRVTNARTGRTERWRARAAWRGGMDMRIEVARPGHQEPLALGFEALFEPHRLRVVEAVQARLVELTLTAGEREALASGAMPLGDLLRESLVTAVQTLGLHPARERLERCHALLDLLELRRLPAPFDAQTDLYRLIQLSDPHTVRRLTPLARRMGIEITA